MTCERMVIGQFSTYQELLHIKRYRYAQQYVAGKSVLDIACGTGYGCAMLHSAGAAHVHGIDISGEAIEYASRTYARPGIVFEVGNAEDLSQVPNESYDVVTSFETIEHLPNVEQYLTEIQRVLRPSGIYLVSTPDRRLASTMYPLRRKPNNEFHLREYTRQEFLLVLEKRFLISECLGQSYVAWMFVFWPIQVAFKAACYVFRALGAYRIIDGIYHNCKHTDVESSLNYKRSVASYWVARTERK